MENIRIFWQLEKQNKMMKRMMNKMTQINRACRHKKTWVVFSGNGEWCYECGALRLMRRVKGTSNMIESASKWVRPVGKGGNNPYDVWLGRCHRRRRKRRKWGQWR